MHPLQSTVEQADLGIPMYVLDSVQAGYKTCVILSIDTDITYALCSASMRRLTAAKILIILS